MSLPSTPSIETLTPEAVAKTIDHALLRPDMTVDEVIEGCRLCAKYQTASVCVKPCNVKIAADVLQGTGVDVGTVIGFPHGNTPAHVKVCEALAAIDDGAVELDMVLNIGHLKSGRFDEVRNEIQVLTVAAKGKLPTCCVKVILECSLLTDEEKITACKLSEDAGADYVKTSTGFSTGGATIADLKLMRANTNPSTTRVKASGGIRTLDFLIECLQAGADRIGASATAAIVDEMRARKAAESKCQ
ncbi:deoxyribose-phosphate aldolase [Coemansia reversa NRRL 1564]|uniref:deoxyribose-phosphate aldolase n=1 Tax=Coemansia reversa (strain ATCC 12441 / NRRL 1564) TaxID=763665 RepID=A0A2G5BG42_COERN|nr:deoxyribose-phosphate aldolase [Coemansia reversa NRRL 1564]|eukprot:PIA17985.1 deoxyribose-phosphate aldolase [Coemansia reversa NRRL 1564]